MRKDEQIAIIQLGRQLRVNRAMFCRSVTDEHSSPA